MKTFKFIAGSLLLSGVLIGSFGMVTAASTADPAQFYKDKVVELVVPMSPGGGTDTYARLVGPYLGRYVGATIVIRNMPGAGGIYGINHVYTSKPNGLTIAITDTGQVVLAQLFRQKGVRYDFNKFNWLGRIDWSKRTLLVNKNSPYHTLKDLEAAKSIKVSDTGKTSGSVLTWALLAHALDWPPEKLSCVLGYGSGRELMLAVMQGEVDGTSLTEDTSARFVQQGLVRAVLVVDRERSIFFPEIPTPYELVKIPEERDWPLAAYLSLQRLRRGLITTPGVSQDKVDFLREAIAKALRDNELHDKAAKVNRNIKPLSGKELEFERIP